MTHPIHSAWCNSWQPPDRRPIYTWAAEHVELPSNLTITGRFNPELSRHFLAIFAALQNDLTRYVTLMKPVDSGGSLIGDIWTTWIPPNDPGAMLVTFQSDPAVKKHAETRINPMLEMCGPCRDLFPPDRHKKRIREVLFRNGMDLYMQGPSLGNLQSTRIRYLRNEEIWMWPNGLRDEALGRIRGWEEIGMSKVFEPSQGGVEGDDLDKTFLLGSQCEWTVPCHSCGRFSIAVGPGADAVYTKRPDGSRWGIVWDDNDHTRNPKTGEWNLAQVIPTVRWECFHCGHPHFFDRCRYEWNRLGKYEAKNPHAAPARESFHFDAIICRSWEKQVEDFLRALQAYRIGVEEPLKKIVQKDRARSWSERYAPADRRSETYDLQSPPQLEGETGMSFDCQDEGVFPAMVVTITKDPNFYVREYRYCYSEQELKELQHKWKIPGGWVFGDSGWGATTRDIYRMCVRNGWIACKGAEENKFTHYIRGQNGRTVSIERSWKGFKGDPEAGLVSQRKKYAFGLKWSNFVIKSELKRLIERGRWVEPRNVQEDDAGNWARYQREMKGERLRVVPRKIDGKLVRRWVAVGPNHAWDNACHHVLRAKVRNLMPDMDLEDHPETLTSAAPVNGADTA